MAPPAESPVTKTRCALILCSPTIRAIICRIEQASPCPRAVSSGLNQLKTPHEGTARSEEHTSELQSPDHLVCRLLLEKKKSRPITHTTRASRLLWITTN